MQLMVAMHSCWHHACAHSLTHLNVQQHHLTSDSHRHQHHCQHRLVMDHRLATITPRLSGTTQLNSNDTSQLTTSEDTTAEDTTTSWLMQASGLHPLLQP